MVFSKLFDYPQTKSAPSGDKFRQKFRRQITPGGERKLVEDGHENVYEAIQLSAKGCSVQELLARFRNGDTSALGVDNSVYADLTNAPKNLIDAQNLLIKAQTVFSELPVDVRKHYNNNLSEFLSSVDSGEFITSTISAAKAKAEAVAASKPLFTPEQEQHIKSMIGGKTDA